MTPIEQLYELAADLDTVGRPDHSARLRSIIVELRRELSETGVRMAWAAVVDALYEARPDWDETAGKSSMENAVAAIRSMAAQCAAQDLQSVQAQLTPPGGVPPVQSGWRLTLNWAQGYFAAAG